MAEKRRSGVAAEPKSAKAESDEEFLCQAGVSALLQGTLLKLVEARPEDPIAFLAEHFTNEAAEMEIGGGGDGDGETKYQQALEEQQLNKALWHLSLAHHSQRSAFSNNIRVAYDLLSQCGSAQHLPGGVQGRLYTEMLRCVCNDSVLSETMAAPLLHHLQCRDYEVVSFELFRQAVLTVAAFSEYVRRGRCLYAAVARSPEQPAKRELCDAVLKALREALDTSHGPDATRYLEASAKISPAELARAMAETQGTSREQEGPSMDMHNGQEVRRRRINYHCEFLQWFAADLCQKRRMHRATAHVIKPNEDPHVNNSAGCLLPDHPPCPRTKAGLLGSR
ncbi:tubulin polyglutamylase complex subunit 1 isoform X1 [Clarias gariepinus]|uniref:tubulin polyglutamylase complex subunit 1 isoform X1 n=1 Tax=Clarias gariepinus TaxID=13013 RepID=UPI00234CCB9B|nr:tubulin polyglutamylase complex subunit 1 isoform X1 [Clarias gariepinus]